MQAEDPTRKGYFRKLSRTESSWSQAESRSFRRSIRESSVESRLLVLHSRRLLLCCAQRSGGRSSRSSHDEDSIERLRRDLDSAETAYMAADGTRHAAIRSAWLRRRYAALVRCAAASAADLTARAQASPPERQFEISTYVQMLDDLIEQWSEALAPS